MSKMAENYISDVLQLGNLRALDGVSCSKTNEDSLESLHPTVDINSDDGDDDCERIQDSA